MHAPAAPLRAPLPGLGATVVEPAELYRSSAGGKREDVAPLCPVFEPLGRRPCLGGQVCLLVVVSAFVAHALERQVGEGRRELCAREDAAPRNFGDLTGEWIGFVSFERDES